MRHAAHKAAKVSHAQFSLSKALFTANRGSHTAKAVRMAQLAEGGAVVGLAPEVVDKLNEVAPMSRRAMRQLSAMSPEQLQGMAGGGIPGLPPGLMPPKK